MTHRQRELLVFICAYLAEHGGVSPSFNEMQRALGLSSKSGVFRLIDALREQGFVERDANRVRSVRVLRAPPETAEPPRRTPSTGSVAIPLYSMQGPIAATGPYPFRDHPTCAEWMFDPRHKLRA